MYNTESFEQKCPTKTSSDVMDIGHCLKVFAHISSNVKRAYPQKIEWVYRKIG